MKLALLMLQVIFELSNFELGGPEFYFVNPRNLHPKKLCMKRSNMFFSPIDVDNTYYAGQGNGMCV